MDRRRWKTGPSGSIARPTGSRPIRSIDPCFVQKEGTLNMRTLDFSPLYRSVVGFDRLADLLDAASSETANGYPPYNIERTDDNAYRIDIAVAGFKPDDLAIEVKENLLTVQGKKGGGDEGRRYLHRGLAERNFERRFQLADYVVVTDAQLADGLLSISLRRELPEALKPRTIEISAPKSEALITAETKKAA
jgi:molecular chaperone IbpA